MARNFKARWYMNPNPMDVGMHKLNFQDVFVLCHTDNYNEKVQMFVPEGENKVAVFVSTKTADILMKRSVEFPIAEYTIPTALIPNTKWPAEGDTVVQHDRDQTTGAPIQTAAPEGSPVSDSPLTIPEAAVKAFAGNAKYREFFRGVPEFMSGYGDQIPAFDSNSRSGRNLVAMQYIYGANLGAILHVVEEWLGPNTLSNHGSLVDLFFERKWTDPSHFQLTTLNAFLNGSLADVPEYKAQGSIVQPKPTSKFLVMCNQFLDDPRAYTLARTSSSYQNFLISDMATLSAINSPDYDPEARLQKAFVDNISSTLSQWGLQDLYSEAELKANSGAYQEAVKWVELGMPNKEDRYQARVGNWGVIPKLETAITEFNVVKVYDYLKTNGGLLHTADQFEQVFTWSGQYIQIRQIIQTSINKGIEAAFAALNQLLLDWWETRGGLAAFRTELVQAHELMKIHALLAWAYKCWTAESLSTFSQTMFTSTFRPNATHNSLPYFTSDMRNTNSSNFVQMLTAYVATYKEECGWRPDHRSNNPMFNFLVQITESESAKAYFTAQPHPLMALDSMISVDCIIAGYVDGVIDLSKIEAFAPKAKSLPVSEDDEDAERAAEPAVTDTDFLIGADSHFRDVIKGGHRLGGSVGKYHKVKPYNPATGIHVPLLDSLKNKNLMPIVERWAKENTKSGKVTLLDPEIIADLDANSKHIGLKQKLHMHNLVLLDGDAMNEQTMVLTMPYGGQMLMIIIINSKQMVDLFGGYNTSAVLQALTHEFGHHLFHGYLKNVLRTRYDSEVKGKRLYPTSKNYGSAAQSASEQFAILAEYMVWGCSARNLYYSNGASVVSEFLSNNYMTDAMLNHKKS